jgi:hypothetical protein
MGELCIIEEESFTPQRGDQERVLGKFSELTNYTATSRLVEGIGDG